MNTLDDLIKFFIDESKLWHETSKKHELYSISEERCNTRFHTFLIALKKAKELKCAIQFKDAGISCNDYLFKMKLQDGRTLNEVIEAGDDTAPYVKHIIEEEKIRQEAYKRSGLADSKATATDDWKATISIPRCENE